MPAASFEETIVSEPSWEGAILTTANQTIVTAYEAYAANSMANWTAAIDTVLPLPSEEEEEG